MNEPWEFPVDRGARRQNFCKLAYSHPAKMHLGLLQRLIDLYTQPGDTVLDPMAGSGSLMIAATQQRNVILRDLEQEYVALMQMSLPLIRRRAGLFGGLIDIDQADARTLECPRFDCIITSPPYGFETGMGVTDERRVHLAAMGKMWVNKIGETSGVSWLGGFRYEGGQNNAGNKSGRNYWRDMTAIYARLICLLPPPGKLILVIKNHYRRGKLRDVVGQTIQVVQGQGLQLVARHARAITHPSIWQRRRKEKGLPVVEEEDVLVFGKPEVKS